MKLRVAEESDSSRLKSFFARMLLPGNVDFAIERPGSFFDHYRLQSPDFKTLILVDDEKDEIEGMASVVFREGRVGGVKQIYGYATDLRIANSRAAVLQWSQLFLPALEALQKERGCRYVFSAIEQFENQAYNALIRPRHVRRHLPRYFLLRRFKVVGVQARLPWAAKPLSAVKVTPAQPSDLESLCLYLDRRARLRPFALLYDPDTFLERLQNWHGLHLDHFLLAKAPDGRILGCTALWDPSDVQVARPMAYHGYALTAFSMLKITGALRLSRSLPFPGEALRARQMIFLNADNPDVFYSLLHHCWEIVPRTETLYYLHFNQHLNTIPNGGFALTALPFALYTILPPNEILPSFLEPHPGVLPPEFEISYL